jgi:SSS family solute:Na+ symporter
MPPNNFNFTLTAFDVFVMVFYAVAIIGYGLYKGKRKSSEDYFLGGRSMTWPIIGISLFAANISSNTLVGLAGDAFKTNTHVFNYEWMAVVVLVVFAAFFLPFYLRSKVYTMPEFLERRYDGRSRYYFSIITLFANVVVDTASGLYVGMLVLKIVFPETPTWVLVSLLALSAAIYTIPGGLSSVIHTEVIQAALLMLCAVILTWFCFQEVGGWSGLIEGLVARKGIPPVGDQTPEQIFSLVRPIDDAFMPWTGLVIGVPILGFYFWATNQFMVQRALSAKDLHHGRLGALFAGFLKLWVLFFMVFPGTVAILLFSDLDLTFLNYMVERDGVKVPCQSLLDCPNMTYPVLIFSLLPKGMLGLVLAGMLAAMMSSISATFNSASTLVTMDFIQKFRPGMTSEQLVRAGQIATLVLVVLAAAWAPQIERFGSLFEYLQKVLSYIVPPVVAVFLLGVFWKRANSHGAFAALISGFLIAGFMVGSLIGNWVPALNSIHFLNFAGILLLICMGIQIVVSLATTPPPPEKVQEYTYTSATWREDGATLVGLPWYKNYRTLSVILLLITAVLIGYFW